MTTVVADTGDLGAVARLKPVDCTTTPTIALKAIDDPEYRNVVEEALTWGRKRSGDAARVAAATADRLAVSVGVELLRLVPGFVSTEVDANLSFNIGALVARARQIMDAYKQRGVGPERLLIKLASTWEGIRAAEILQSEGVKCNMTLLLNRAQAIASADAGAFLISPFVGRILDWHLANGAEKPATPQDDPGVQSVTRIWHHYKRHGFNTVVMGASFRNTGQVLALAGCDRLTISPDLLATLAESEGEVPRALVDSGERAPAPTRMDERTFRWDHNEDAMATDKLGDGIRKFAADQRKLEAMLAERLG